MNIDKQKAITCFELLVLILIVLFAFFIAFIPHMNYCFPAHIDEWNQIAYSQAMLQAGSIDFEEPFYGKWSEKCQRKLKI